MKLCRLFKMMRMQLYGYILSFCRCFWLTQSYLCVISMVNSYAGFHRSLKSPWIFSTSQGVGCFWKATGSSKSLQSVPESSGMCPFYDMCFIHWRFIMCLFINLS